MRRKGIDYESPFRSRFRISRSKSSFIATCCRMKRADTRLTDSGSYNDVRYNDHLRFCFLPVQHKDRFTIGGDQ